MKRWSWAALAAALLLAGGSSPAREPDALALVRVLGADGPGPVALTAVCGGEDQRDQSRGRCAGTDFSQALAALPWSGGTEELSLTSVSYLLVGRDVDLEKVLLEVLRNEELGASATVWLAEEGAGTLLERCQDPAAVLELLDRQGADAPTAAQALAALLNGETLTLPLLRGGEDGPVWLGREEWRSGG